MHPVAEKCHWGWVVRWIDYNRYSKFSPHSKIHKRTGEDTKLQTVCITLNERFKINSIYHCLRWAPAWLHLQRGCAEQVVGWLSWWVLDRDARHPRSLLRRGSRPCERLNSLCIVPLRQICMQVLHNSCVSVQFLFRPCSGWQEWPPLPRHTLPSSPSYCPGVSLSRPWAVKPLRGQEAPNHPLLH